MMPELGGGGTAGPQYFPDQLTLFQVRGGRFCPLYCFITGTPQIFHLPASLDLTLNTKALVDEALKGVVVGCFLYPH